VPIYCLYSCFMVIGELLNISKIDHNGGVGYSCMY
jgi:hypothetical protein